jgi:hypothetical protein
MKVDSKHCCNLHSLKKQNSTSVNQPILTSNRYASLINLQDPLVNINQTIAANELGLVQDIQREDRQTEPSNVEASCRHLIPTTLNGKIYPEAVNEPVNCAIKRNPRLVNEVSINNIPSTGKSSAANTK